MHDSAWWARVGRGAGEGRGRGGGRGARASLLKKFDKGAGSVMKTGATAWTLEHISSVADAAEAEGLIRAF